MQRYWHWWAIGTLSATYFILNWNPLFVLLPQYIWDDNIQYQLSISLSEGKWLGQYNMITLIKGVVFPAWTALLHIAHIPLWVGNSLFMLVGCAALIYALSKLSVNRWALVALYGLLLFNPMGTDRVYRDYMIPGITLLVCAWAIGTYATLTTWRELKFSSALRDLFTFTAIGMVSLPAWYFIREDGFWLMPTVLMLLIVAFLYFLYACRPHTIWQMGIFCSVALILLLPLLTVKAAGAVIASLNKVHYDRYVVNDYFSEDFQSAYAALSRVNDSDEIHLTVPISFDMREKIYKVSPKFKALEPCLDGPPPTSVWCTKYRDSGTNHELVRDYESGWFPFALRTAVERAGYYKNATTASKYYNALANEVNTACDKGRLSCHSARMHSLMNLPTKASISPWTSNIKTAFSFLLLLPIKDNITHPAVEKTPEMDQMAQYYGVRYLPSESEGLAKTRTTLLNAIYLLYRSVNALLFCVSVLILVGATIIGIKHRKPDWKILTVSWLLLGAILMRLVMLAYVHTVSFPTTANIYYEPLYVLMFLFEGITLSMIPRCVQMIRTKVVED